MMRWQFICSARYACAIPDKDKPSVILTGGGFDEEAGHRVSRYNIHGFVKDLPQLTVSRMDHGCGSYRRDDGTQVNTLFCVFLF
jgi:hypothetical protein